MIGLRPDVDASFRETSDQFQKRSDKLRDKNRRKIRLNHLFFIAIHRNVQSSLIIERGRITFYIVCYIGKLDVRSIDTSCI